MLKREWGLKLRDPAKSAQRGPRKAPRRAPKARPKPGVRASTAVEEIRIGMRLKHARLVQGLRLHELAERLNCSESFLSKVENNKVRPSLAMLHQIVGALELNIAQLFADSTDEPTDQIQIVRANHRPIIRTHPLRSGPGIALERLVAITRGSLIEANIHCVEPGGHTDGVISHNGEEIGYLLQGQLELEVNGTWYTFKEGDSFFFHSNLPHGYRNPGKTLAKVLWMNSPPTF
jgi:transcriptional regulator with XRE-family HTH domain